jgi:hypothetical protein
VAYLGNRPALGAYYKLDSIASSFNGVTTTFNLTINGNATIPGSAQNMMIAIGGIMQEPNAAYTVNGSTITFTSAPPTNATFWGIQLGDVLSIGIPSAGSVGPTQISASGTPSSTTFLRGDQNWAGPAAGGGTDSIFYLNGKTVTTNYTIPSTSNAMSTGPISINSGVSVTISTGSRWVVL